MISLLTKCEYYYFKKKEIWDVENKEFSLL